jgi:hemolysin activation/secretion protein
VGGVPQRQYQNRIYRWRHTALSRNWLNDAPLISSTRNLSSLQLGISHTQKVLGGVATFNPTFSHGMPWFNAETDEGKSDDEPAQFRKGA